MMDHHYPISYKKRSWSGDNDSTGTRETISAPGTRKGAKSQFLPETLRTVLRVEPFEKKAKIGKRNRWTSASRYAPSDESIPNNKTNHHAFSLVVKLNFSGRLVISDGTNRFITSNLRESTQPPATLVNLRTSPNFTTPPTARTIRALNTLLTKRSISSVHDHVPFERSWVDETQDFNMRAVCSKIRHPNMPAKDLGKYYTWYNDAVATDAMLPPGIPLSAKEILAYYPHHVRWKNVMLRLSNNGYRGADIMGIQNFFRGLPDQNTTPATMDQYQRDALRTILPGFKTDILNGNNDRNLHTTHLTPGKYIQEERSGHTVPTFDDLLRGLRHLPSGLDARSLTECLNWYLSIRDTFTPKLECNVLHTQALTRALRIPLKPFGPQNLDCNALREWKDNGRFPERKIGSELAHGNTTVSGENGRGDIRQRNQVHLNLDAQTVHLAVRLPLRPVLMFPFLALHGVVGEALKQGIARAETKHTHRGKRAKRKRSWKQNGLQDYPEIRKPQNLKRKES